MRQGWLRYAAMVCVSAVLCVAQAADTPDPATQALEHGRLVVWIVHPAKGGWKGTDGSTQDLTPTLIPRTIQEQTAGSFGQPSSDTGQTAGSYGSRPSEVGSSASDVGQTAGSYGRGPSQIGHDASNVGQTAGSYGQTAGSFGEGLSTIAGAGEAHPTSSRVKVNHTAQWDRLAMVLRSAYPGLELVIDDVREEDLGGELKRTAGSPGAPDVLLGSPLPWVWVKTGDQSQWQLVLPTLGAVAFPAQVETSGEVVKRDHWGGLEPQVAIVAAARNRAQAKAFAVWLSDGGSCQKCGGVTYGPRLTEPIRVARASLDGVVGGDGVGGNADPEMAQSSGEMVRQAALAGVYAAPLDDLKTRLDVIDARANDRMAMVTLRAIVSTAHGFGVLHALVVERRDAQGHWRVLQLTPDLTASMVGEAASLLGSFCESSPTVAHVAGIKQAAPADGDTRSQKPDLWWDNGGGAEMQVVEWQREVSEDQWSGTRLFFVPDQDPRLRTRVTAEFASQAGPYRWRVWSLGKGGVVVLSPWRNMVIQ